MIQNGSHAKTHLTLIRPRLKARKLSARPCCRSIYEDKTASLARPSLPEGNGYKARKTSRKNLNMLEGAQYFVLCSHNMHELRSRMFLLVSFTVVERQLCFCVG